MMLEYIAPSCAEMDLHLGAGVCDSPIDGGFGEDMVTDDVINW